MEISGPPPKATPGMKWSQDMERLSEEKKAALRQAAQEHGLYNPRHEHDACGMGFVAHIKGE
jgi:hypothetical protein